jgi:hypothetical protein
MSSPPSDENHSVNLAIWLPEPFLKVLRPIAPLGTSTRNTQNPGKHKKFLDQKKEARLLLGIRRSDAIWFMTLNMMDAIRALRNVGQRMIAG